MHSIEVTTDNDEVIIMQTRIYSGCGEDVVIALHQDQVATVVKALLVSLDELRVNKNG